MPLIHLRHHRHGAKIATLEMEAQYDEQNVWERYTPGQESESAEPETVNEIRRRGRPRKEPEHVYDGG